MTLLADADASTHRLFGIPSGVLGEAFAVVLHHVVDGAYHKLLAG